jgi:hypothetical protein
MRGVITREGPWTWLTLKTLGVTLVLGVLGMHIHVYLLSLFISCLFCFLFLISRNYVISLESGEGFYKTMEGTVKSKGVKQRTHKVHVDDGRIFLSFSFFFFLNICFVFCHCFLLI